MTRMILTYEWLHHRKMLLLLLALLPFYFVLMTHMVIDAKPLIIITALMSGFLPFTLFLREDKFKAQSLICSLPVERSRVMAMRYAILWGLTLLFFAIILAVAHFSPFSGIGISTLITLDAFLLFLCLVSLIIAILYPFSVYFGMMGFIIVLVALQFLGLGVQALFLVFGRGRDLVSIPRAIAASLHASRIALGEPLFYGVLLILIVSLNAISLIVSIRLFQNKEI